MSAPRKSVLAVEDDANDAMLLKTAFGEIRPDCSLSFLNDGKQATQYLLGTGEYSDRAAHPFPDLMLLDLKLPWMSGLEVLGWLHEHPEVKAGLRVVILTSFISPGTTQAVSELGADELLEKPLGYQDFKEQLQGLLNRWLGVPKG